MTLQEAGQDIRKAMKAQSGISSELWDFLKTHGGELAKSFSNDERETLALLAAEASLYDLAFQLDLQDPFFRCQAALYLGRKNEFSKSFSELNGFKKDAVDMSRLRMEGSFVEAIEVFEKRISPNLMTNSLNPLDHAEILLWAGSPYFNASRYATAFNLYLEAAKLYFDDGSLGKAAIAYFNAAVSADYLGLAHEVTDLLARVDELLNRYALVGLQKTLKLFRIQKMVADGEFESALILGGELAQDSTLTSVQKVLCFQALSRAQIETGHLIEAEISLNRARQVITGNKFYQYETFQLALEMDLGNLIFRKVARGPLFNNPKKAEDPRAQAAFKLSLGRVAFCNGETQKALKILRELKLELPATIQRGLYLRDLELRWEHHLQPADSRARGFEVQILKAAADRQSSHLKFLIEDFKKKSEAHGNPWGKTLVHLAKGFSVF